MSKRTLGVRDREILYSIYKGRCAACGKRIGLTEMVVGHKRAYARGGKTNFRNCVPLCYSCNRLQGTDDFSTFMRKLGRKPLKASRSVKRKVGAKDLVDWVVDILYSVIIGLIGFIGIYLSLKNLFLR